MKRIVLGLLALLVSMAGLVAVSSAPATAACPYTNCIATATNTKAKSNVRVGTRVTIRVGVRAAGNVSPAGNVKMVIRKKGKRGIVFQQTKAVQPASPGRSTTQFKTPRLAKGQYVIVHKYVPATGSVFKASQRQRQLTVR